MNEWRIVQLANSLIDRCVTTGTGSFNRIRSIGDVDVRLVHFLFENICRSIIEQMTVPIPDIRTHPIDYVDFVIDTIAHQLLNVELRISSKKFVDGDLKTQWSLLDIFDQIAKCIDAIPTSRQTNAIRPTTNTALNRIRIANRATSVLYSPCTANRRYQHRRVHQIRPRPISKQQEINVSSRPTALQAATYQLQLDQLRCRSPTVNVTTTTATAVEPTIIGQKMKRANDQRNNIIDMRRARAVLKNARIIQKQRHIREIAKQREHQRLALSSAISRESDNQRTIEANANAWIESWRRTRLDIIRDRHHLSGRQNRPLTVIDRIRVLEERHRNRRRALSANNGTD